MPGTSDSLASRVCSIGTFCLGMCISCAGWILLHQSDIEIIVATLVALLLVSDFFILLELFGLCLHRSNSVYTRPIHLSRPASITAVISAYLPNEQAIIRQTLDYFLTELSCHGGLTVMLAYNSPVLLPIENELHQYAARENRLKVIRVPNSNRKATNISFILPLITTPIVAFFDADSRPRKHSLDRASMWFEAGADFVQGANVIRSPKGWLQRLVATEVAQKYGVSYLGRFIAFSTGYFSGSNAYWRTPLAQILLSRSDAQVEDIDMSVRAMLQGATLAYDPRIVATEEAPPDLTAWWRQRVRWAQGWAELTHRYQVAIWRSSHLRVCQKLIWTSFLLYRRIIVPGAGILLIIAFPIGSIDARKWTVGVLIVRFLFQLCLTAIALTSLHLSRISNLKQYCAHTMIYVFVYPLYDSVRLVTVCWGSSAFFRRPREWHCTKRAETLAAP